MASVEDFVYRFLGIHPSQLNSWKVTSGATSCGMITNTLTCNLNPAAVFRPSGRLLSAEVKIPMERVGSLIPTALSYDEVEVLLVRGKETSELFGILAKTMLIEE